MNTSNRRIYIDIDDVLSHTIARLGQLLHQHFDKRVPYEEITEFDLARSFGLEEEEVERFLEIAHEPDAIRSIALVEGARPALEGWSRAGYEIHLLTGRPPFTEDATRAWLEQHAIPHVQLDFVDKYGRAHAWGEDVEVLDLDDVRQLEFCLAVEDSLEVAVFLAAELEVEVALIDHPWNRDPSRIPDRARERIVRCRGWSEVVARFPDP